MSYPPLKNEINPGEVHIESTPNGKYALRILQYYRRCCDITWETNNLSDKDKAFYDAMNEHQKERAKELDTAIERIAHW